LHTPDDAHRERLTGQSMDNTEAPKSSQERKPEALLPEGRQQAVLPPGRAGTRARRRRPWLWLAGAGLLLLFCFLVYRSGALGALAGKGAAPPKQPQGAAITVAQSTTGNMNIFVDALGTVTPVYTVTLYSQITGQVTGVHYNEGQMVKTGDALVDIDPRPYQSMLTQAEGTLERDQGLLAQAQMDLQRYQAAWARNAIPKQELDDQEKLVIQDQGTVKADQGTVDYDRVELSYCHIVSPITGRVGLRLVDPGNTVFSGSSSTLVVITQLQPITVVFDVSEDDLPQVQEQLQAGHTLTVDAFDRANEKQIEAGKLTSLDNEVDTATGTIKFRAEFPNRKMALFPNQFVNARLLVKTLSKVTLVPSAAVQQNGTAAFVYVVNSDNKVSVQNVTVLSSNDEQTAVQGLNPGVTVAISGFDRLENGVAVSIRGQGQGSQGSKATTGGPQ
jgi:membrane fusion protein, multidrug efflux system